MEKKEQLVEELKAKATAIAAKHGKAALHDVNDELVPALLDLVAEMIPGQIDDVILGVAKTPINAALDQMIEAI